MFTPVKLSMEVKPPGTPRWAAEWTSPDGTRMVGFGNDPATACGEVAALAMTNMTGQKVHTNQEAAAYFHPELAK